MAAPPSRRNGFAGPTCGRHLMPPLHHCHHHARNLALAAPLLLPHSLSMLCRAFLKAQCAKSQDVTKAWPARCVDIFPAGPQELRVSNNLLLELPYELASLQLLQVPPALVWSKLRLQSAPQVHTCNTQNHKPKTHPTGGFLHQDPDSSLIPPPAT